MYLQSIKSVKNNAAMSVNRSILKKSRHIGFGVFIVHSSMERKLYLYSPMLTLSPSLSPGVRGVGENLVVGRLLCNGQCAYPLITLPDRE